MFEQQFDYRLGKAAITLFGTPGRPGATVLDPRRTGASPLGSRRAVHVTTTWEMTMRRYDEPIHVKRGQDRAAPEQFVWRGRLWLVRDIITRWLETGAWWDSPLVRSARGDDVEPLPSEETDLLAEHEVWRVLAASGALGSPGVYELDNARGTGGWRLRAVVD